MAAVVGSLRADLEANVAKFKTDMGQAADSVDKATGRMKQSATSASQAGKAFTEFGRTVRSALALGGAVAVAAFVQQSIKGAIASEEMADQLDRQFGAMGDSVEEWAERTARELGRVDDELKEAVFSFGNLFQKVVPTQGAAADMSETMARLAVDVAAFNRVPIADATTALQKGLAGSTRGLKQFGILMTEAEVKARAVKMGLAATTKEVSAQDKVLASYNLILEKTGNVHGFAASQIGTTSGKMKAFQGQVDALADDLGAILIPVLSTVVGWLDLYAQGIKTILGDTDEFMLGLEILQARIFGGDEHAIVQRFRDAQGAMDETARSAKTNGGIIEEEFENDTESVKRLVNELRRFTDQAFDASLAVRDFGIPDLSGDTRVMNDLNDRFESLSRSLRGQIEDMKEADKGTGRYVEQIIALQRALDGLVLKYDAASEAAIGLFLAETRANNARLTEQLGGMQRGAEALATAGGAAGVLSENQKRMRDLEQALQADRESGIARLAEMEADRALALAQNNGAEAARLEQLIGAQQTYNDLVDATTAKQIFAQEKLAEMTEVWFGITRDTFADLFKGLRDAGDKFDFAEWGANFIRRLSDSVLERKADQLTETLFGFLGLDNGKTQDVQTINARTLNIMSGGASAGNAFGGFGGTAPAGEGGGLMGAIVNGATGFLGKIFGGFFADGGGLRPGEWGIAGENGPEILRGGMHGMQIDDGGPGDARDVTQNFVFPNANVDGFRANRRQVAQMARRQFS